MVETYCNEIREQYNSKLGNPIYCRGWMKNIPPPNNISETLLSEIIKYLLDTYLNVLKYSKWDHDIICVFNDEKTLAITDSDYFPQNNSSKDFDYFLRYTASKNCNLRVMKFNVDESPYLIWYKNEHWANALLYYHLTTNFSSEGYNFVEFIVSGNTYNSSIIYLIQDVVGYLTETNIFRQLWIDTLQEFYKLNERYPSDYEKRQLAENIYKHHSKYIQDNMPYEDMIKFYNAFYNKYKDLTMKEGFTRRDFKMQQDIVKRWLKHIKDNEKLKLYSRSDDSIAIVDNILSNITV